MNRAARRPVTLFIDAEEKLIDSFSALHCRIFN